MSDIVELVWNELQSQIQELRTTINQQSIKTERAEYTDGIPAYTFASLPTAGLATGTSYVTIVWCSNARKSGEGAGVGTGVLAIYNSAGGNWLRAGDYTALTI
ncbi:MAG: hypothetical protein ABI690_13580 [Chloroflexota bacterium]